MEPGSQTFIDVEKEQYTRQQERLARSRADVVVERVPVEKLLHESGAFVGIDLGTTNSCIAYIDPTTTQPQIIPSPSGSWVFPTCVTFDKDHTKRIYGEEARVSSRTNPATTLVSGKRLIGRRVGELQRVTDELRKTTIIHMTENGEVAVDVSGRTYTVVHITAMFLRTSSAWRRST